MGLFDDLIPSGSAAATAPRGIFDDLLPASSAAGWATHEERVEGIRNKTGQWWAPLSTRAPVQNGPLAEPAKFAATAAARAGAGLADFAFDPLYALRYLVSPQLAEAERGSGGLLAAPGSAAADALFKVTGIPEYQPATPGGRLGLSTATGAAAGGPFGMIPAAMGAAGGLIGQSGMELTGNPRVAAALSLSPALAAPIAGRLRGVGLSPEGRAAMNLSGDIMRDKAAGGPDIDAIRAALMPGRGMTPKPLALADVVGATAQGRGEAIANQPGAGAQIAETFLRSRDTGAGPRLLGDLNEGLGAGPSAIKTAEALAEKRAQQAAPLYDQALSRERTYHSDRLDGFLEDPIMRQGLSLGLEVQRLESLAQGRPFKPDDYTIVFDDSGTPRFSPTPNMRTLDAAKRGLDSILDQYRDPQSGRLVLDQRGRAIDQVRQSYLKELDSLNPEYAAARQAWSGPSQSIGAVKQGGDVFNKQPEQIAADLERLAPGDREFYLLGARDALAQRIAKTSAGGNESLRIVGNQHIQNQLRQLFPDDQSYGAFIGQAQLESLMYRTMNNTLGNSRTFRRAAHADAEGQNASGGGMGISPANIAALFHDPWVAVPTMALKAARGITAMGGRPNPAVNQEVAKMLFSSDPAANAAALDAIMAAQGAPVPFSLSGVVPPLLSIAGERPKR